MTRKSARLRKRGETSHPPKVGVGPTTNGRLQFIGLLVEISYMRSLAFSSRLSGETGQG